MQESSRYRDALSITAITVLVAAIHAEPSVVLGGCEKDVGLFVAAMSGGRDGFQDTPEVSDRGRQ